MGEEEFNKKKKQEWEEIEESEWKKESQLWEIFGFNIRSYWNDNEKEIMKRKKAFSYIEILLKIALICFALWIIASVVQYIKGLYIAR